MNRRTLLRWLGLAPAAAVLPAVASKSHVLIPGYMPLPVDPIVALPVIVQRGLYQCGTCASVLRFDEVPYGKMQTLSHAVARCDNRRCESHGLRVSVPIERMVCEIVGRDPEF